LCRLDCNGLVVIISIGEYIVRVNIKLISMHIKYYVWGVIVVTILIFVTRRGCKGIIIIVFIVIIIVIIGVIIVFIL
jgi:hypothetical protein